RRRFRSLRRLLERGAEPSFSVREAWEGCDGTDGMRLVAGLIDWIEGPNGNHGRPRCPTQAVVETLRFFLREGVQWRELRATGDRGCGARRRGRPMGRGG